MKEHHEKQVIKIAKAEGLSDQDARKAMRRFQQSISNLKTQRKHEKPTIKYIGSREAPERIEVHLIQEGTADQMRNKARIVFETHLQSQDKDPDLWQKTEHKTRGSLHISVYKPAQEEEDEPTPSRATRSKSKSKGIAQAFKSMSKEEQQAVIQKMKQAL